MLLTSIYINIFICLLMLIFQWRENKTVVYLILIIIIFNIRQLSGLLISSYQKEDDLVKILFKADPLVYLIGPLILYYFKSLIQGKLVFDYKFLLFMLPAFVIFVNSLPYYQLPLQEKLNVIKSIKQNSYVLNFPHRHTLLFSFKTQTKFIIISNFLFFIYSIRYYILERKAIQLKTKNIQFIHTNFLLFLISIFPGLLILIYSSYRFSKFSISTTDNSEYHYLFTIVTPISFILFPKLIYGFNSNSTISQIFQNLINRLFSDTTHLATEIAEQSSDYERIIRFIETKKPYLNSNFSLHTLSHDLNMPHVRLSNCFSKEIKTTFPEYRNRKRIEHSIQLFKENEHRQISIEGIATQCGFKNRSSFYLAFKAEYDMTPTEWIAKYL